MIDQELYTHILTNLTLTTDFRFGSAEGSTAPYIVMFKVSDLERPEVLCNDQGESGRALFQFSAYAGGTEGAGANAAATVVLLQALKIQVAGILGIIGSTPNDYRIWQNITGGVRLLGDGSETLQTWGAFFECEIWWDKI